jgi:hypothetical protein
MICFLVSMFDSYAQDTLIMYNGKQKTGIKLVGIEENTVFYGISKGEKVKMKQLPSEQVYAIFTDQEREIVTFLTDSTGNDLTRVQMFDYIDGMMDSRENYQNVAIPVTGFVISAGAGAILGVPLGLLVPALYPGVIAMKEPKTNNLRGLADEKKENEYYVFGYKSVAKQKKIWSSVISVGSGILAGMLVYIYYVVPNQ